YTNDADRVLLLSRAAASLLTLLLAVVVFLATAELFGLGAAFVALGLLVFEPNVLAHGALVTTDMGATLGMFAGVYAFYRFVKKRSLLRLVACGLAVGIALCTKHSSVFVVPILAVLGALEIGSARPVVGRIGDALRMTASLIGITAIALVVLWSAYGFRYHARPEPRRMTPTLAEFAPIDSWRGDII